MSANWRRCRLEVLGFAERELGIMKNNPETCCRCKHYKPLKEAQKCGESNYVYGFCFKDFRDGHGFAYPVYIPESTIICKAFAKRSSNGYEYNLPQEMKCEICRKKVKQQFDKIISEM